MARVKLADIATIITGNTPKTSDNQNYASNDICFVKPSDIDDNELTDVHYTEYYISEYARNKARILPPQSILVTCIGIVGKVGINAFECAFNQQINAVIPDREKCDCRYLAYALQYAKPKLQSIANAPVVPILNKSQFSNIDIFLPSLAEQRKIAAVLDKVSDLIAKRRQQLTKLGELVKSRFIELFGEPLSNQKGWQTMPVVKAAPIKSRRGNLADKIWLLNLDAVEAQTGKVLFKHRVQSEGINASTVYFTTENVLYSKLRPYLNKVVMPDEDGVATSEMIPMCPLADRLNRAYLCYWLRSDTFVKHISEKVAGAKMPRVSMDYFRSLSIELPPIELQEQFAAFVEQTDKSKLAIQKGLEQLEMLKKALMQKFFEV